MHTLLNSESIPYLIVFVLPGYLSWSVWRVLFPVRTARVADSLIAIVMIGLVNSFLVGWVIPDVRELKSLVAQVASFAGVYLIAPVLWPLIIRALLQIPFVSQRIVHPIPKAWDFFFGLHVPCFVLARLKNGTLLGGVMGSRSFASSYPSDEDLYLEQLWKVTAQGQFVAPLPHTRGALICRSDCEYIQFIEMRRSDGKERNTSSGSGKPEKGLSAPRRRLYSHPPTGLSAG